MPEGELLKKSNIDKIRHVSTCNPAGFMDAAEVARACSVQIPTVIIQGRYDICCPVKTAWELHKVFCEAKFTIIPDAGHSAAEPGIEEALLRATDTFADL